MKHDIEVDGSVARRKHIDAFYHIDQMYPIRLAPRLTECQYIDMSRVLEIRVSLLAFQVLSHSVAAVLTVTGQNGTGQNGTDKMVRTKWYMDKMVWDKMVWTKWYGQNGTDKMVVIFRIDYNSSEFNSYLVTKSHSEMINIQRKPKRIKVEAGLMKKIILSMRVELMY